METYLVIITTALVLTQIIRLVQNTIQLRYTAEAKRKNAEVEQLWCDLVNTMSELIEVTNRQIEEMGDFWK